MKGYLKYLKMFLIGLLIVFIGVYGYTWVRLYNENQDKKDGLDRVIHTTGDAFVYIIWMIGVYIYYNFIVSSDDDKWDWQGEPA
jgi:hypothetical protein